MRVGTIGVMGAALLLAACGKSGTPEGGAASDANAGMMVSNEVLMSDDMGAANMVDASNGATAGNVAE